jgi:NAD+ kinase
MTMPLELVLVRHGESEGNLATGRSKGGDHTSYTGDFRGRHSSNWRLTELGREQAEAAGKFITSNLEGEFDRYYTSDYLRALETAAHLNLPDARWYLEFYLRERDAGTLDAVSNIERETRFAEEQWRRKKNKFFYSAPGGESLADVCLRIDRVLQTLHREQSDKRVIAVCHGHVMWAFRMRLERLSHRHFLELDESDDPHHEIHNCQIIQYTRVSPDTGEVAPHLNWMRSICPWDTTRSSNQWQTIHRPWYSNADLVQMAEQIPQLVYNREPELVPVVGQPV